MQSTVLFCRKKVKAISGIFTFDNLLTSAYFVYWKALAYCHFLKNYNFIICCNLHLRYWDTLLDSLWPRFMKIVEMNAQSVKQTDPQKLGNIDIQPHYVSLILPCCYNYVWLFYIRSRPRLIFHSWFKKLCLLYTRLSQESLTKF